MVTSEDCRVNSKIYRKSVPTLNVTIGQQEAQLQVVQCRFDDASVR